MKEATIKNGTVAISGSGSLSLLSGSQTNVLEGITLQGDVSTGNASFTLKDSLVLNGTLTTNGATITSANNVAISGTGTLSLTNTFLYSAAIGTPNMLTFGNDITIEGSGFRTGSGFLSILNQGTMRISSNVATTRLAFAADYTFENTGSIEILDDATLELESLVGNGVGDLTLGTGSQLILYEDLTQPILGNITNNGGNVVLRGILDLETGTLNLNDSTGVWQVKGGTIKNGTIAISGSSNLSVLNSITSVLDNVTLEGEMLITEVGAPLRIQNNLTLNGSLRFQAPFSILQIDGNETIQGTGTLSFETTTLDPLEIYTITEPGEFTIESGITLEGGRVTIGTFKGYAMDFVNKGTIRANVAGQSITIDVTNGSFDNQGTLEELNGGTIIQP